MSSGNQRNVGSTFSLRRLLLQGARIARGNSNSNSNNSSTNGHQPKCDIEKGASTSSTGKNRHDKKIDNSVNKNNLDSSNISPFPLANSSSNLNDGSFSSTSSITNSQQKELIQTAINNAVHQPQRSDSTGQFYCSICYNSPILPNAFYILFTCKHTACQSCLERYLKNEINEFRTEIACPQCSEPMHPSDMEQLLKGQTEYLNKYEDFMVRRFLLSDPDSRWCPAPDCSYAVIATGCASCPRIHCQRPECGLLFCYHCKAEWHPDQTCDAARTSRKIPSENLSQNIKNRDDIKPCPKCQVLIVKMDDGSCNHMVCSICNVEFCWLCMKEITDLHYLSPSGCTFWGKKPWSRKKKLMWQLGTLVGAPVGIALVAGIAVPAMIIGIPVWVGKKIHSKYKYATKPKRNCAVLSGVLGSMLISPVLAGLAVAIGVPILLFYVYGVVPVSLCRAGCDAANNREDDNDFTIDEIGTEPSNNLRNNSDGVSVDAVSRIGAISIGEVSLSAASGSQIGVGGSVNGAAGSMANYSATNFIVCNNSSSRYDRESTNGLAGSILGGHRIEMLSDGSSLENASGSNISNDNASIKALNGYIY